MAASPEEVDAYVRTQITISDTRTKNATYNRIEKTRYPRRSTILKLQKALRGFQTGQDPRWLALLGLRGVGKTTMLSQLFQDVRCTKDHKAFFAMDDAKDTLGVGMREIIQAYERVLNKRLEELAEPLYLFIDEVHFDPNWALSLKTAVDRGPYLFVVMTGSSVSEINRTLDSDTARRVLTETLHPMSFTEYRLLRDRRTMGTSSGVGQQIRHLLYESDSIETAYAGLEKLRPKVIAYWEDIPPTKRQAEIDRYMRLRRFGVLARINLNKYQIGDAIIRVYA